MAGTGPGRWAEHRCHDADAEAELVHFQLFTLLPLCKLKSRIELSFTNGPWTISYVQKLRCFSSPLHRLGLVIPSKIPQLEGPSKDRTLSRAVPRKFFSLLARCLGNKTCHQESGRERGPTESDYDAAELWCSIRSTVRISLRYVVGYKWLCLDGQRICLHSRA
jgi:hypothetical protein